MDTNALVAHARARFDHAAARRVLKEKYEAKMVFAYGGGMWRAGPTADCVVGLRTGQRCCDTGLVRNSC